MIQRIEHGRVQVNEYPAKGQMRRRRRPSRPKSQERENSSAQKSQIFSAIIDLLA